MVEHIGNAIRQTGSYRILLPTERDREIWEDAVNHLENPEAKEMLSDPFYARTIIRKGTGEPAYHDHVHIHLNEGRRKSTVKNSIQKFLTGENGELHLYNETDVEMWNKYKHQLDHNDALFVKHVDY